MLYLQKTKAKTFTSYKSYEAWLSMRFDTKIKCLHSDRSGEYLSNEFQHFKSKGTERCITVHDMPKHNGMAERLNHMLIERVHAMLHMSALPKNLWGEAIMHATWLKNCLSMRRLRTKTPYETLYYLKKPNLSNIQFGAAASKFTIIQAQNLICGCMMDSGLYSTWIAMVTAFIGWI